MSAPASAASLLVTAYAMCFGGLLMFGARLGDRLGHRRTLLGGVAGFAVGSLLAAAAPSLAVLVAGRCVQGAAAAMSVPAALRLIVATTRDAAARGRALSVWSAAGAAAGAMGYLLGGALTAIAGWRAMFWLNVPLAAVLVAGILRQTERDDEHEHDGLDVLGALVFVSAVMSVVLAGSQLARPGRVVTSLMIIAGGIALSALFAWIERRAPNPLVRGEAIRQRHVRIGTGAAFLNTATTSPVIAIATLELQRTGHLSPFAAGLRLLPFSVGVIGGSAVARAALARLSRIAVTALGLGAIAAGDGLLLVPDPSGWLLAACVAIAGVGIGLSSVASTSLGTDVEAPLQAAAAGILNTAAQLGTGLGVAALLLLATATAHSSAPVRGFRLGWGAAALLAFVGSAYVVLRGAEAPINGSRRARARRPPVEAA